MLCKMTEVAKLYGAVGEVVQRESGEIYIRPYENTKISQDILDETIRINKKVYNRLPLVHLGKGLIQITSTNDGKSDADVSEELKYDYAEAVFTETAGRLMIRINDIECGE